VAFFIAHDLRGCVKNKELTLSLRIPLGKFLSPHSGIVDLKREGLLKTVKNNDFPPLLLERDGEKRSIFVIKNFEQLFC